jgi:hypothetical protein
MSREFLNPKSPFERHQFWDGAVSLPDQPHILTHHTPWPDQKQYHHCYPIVLEGRRAKKFQAHTANTTSVACLSVKPEFITTP